MASVLVNEISVAKAAFVWIKIKHLYINRGRYVPASVCRGKAQRSRLVSQGPRLAAGQPRAKALRARSRGETARGKAAYNLVNHKS